MVYYYFSFITSFPCTSTWSQRKKKTQKWARLITSNISDLLNLYISRRNLSYLDGPIADQQKKAYEKNIYKAHGYNNDKYNEPSPSVMFRNLPAGTTEDEV